MATQLSTDLLFKVWELSDIDQDGALDLDEFAVAMYLCEIGNTGESIPDALPEDIVPPSRRHLF